MKFQFTCPICGARCNPPLKQYYKHLDRCSLVDLRIRRKLPPPDPPVEDPNPSLRNPAFKIRTHHTDNFSAAYKLVYEAYICESVLPSLREKHAEKHAELMLIEVDRRWRDHKFMVKWNFRFLSYMDRHSVNIPAFHDVGISCFKKLVYEVVKDEVRDAVISLIDQERDDEQIDRSLLKNIIYMFVEIGIGSMDQYENDFEKAMLVDTAAYYSQKASNWISEYSFPDYMLRTDECFKREKDIVGHYLHSSSETKLLDKVQNELLTVYASQLLETEHSGCHALLRDDKTEDLSRVYRLFSPITRGLDPVSNIFKQHVTGEGTALVKQAEDAASTKKAEKRDIVGPQELAFVRKVIELHDKYIAYVRDCFQNHILFHEALKEAFKVFCNKGVGGSSSAELLATFCDNILKKGGSEELSDEAIEETLEKVVTLLAYISDKDLFVEFYRKKLAHRLVFDNCANDDHERSFLTKLKQQCGCQFTTRMEKMVNDITLARKNQTSFEEYCKNNPDANPGIDFTVTVLQSNLWPNERSLDLNLPAELVKCVELFDKFYKTENQKRKLTWNPLGTLSINGKFDAKTIEIIATTYQAAALLLFNSSERLSYSEIVTQLNLTDEDVIAVLNSLSCGKYKILNKEPSTPNTISPIDYFEVNTKFTDESSKIKIDLPPPVGERKKVIGHVNNDRKFAIDACIVRIMKNKKVLGHTQLVLECVEHLEKKFKIDLKVVKQRIDQLINRDYLERDEDNPELLRYLP